MWRRALFWTLLVLGTVVTAEVMVRLFLDPPARYPKSRDPPMVTHAVRGYALKPGAVGTYFAGGRRTRIVINTRGFRDGPYGDAATARVRVLSVGDSFTLGLGVDSTEPWPERLEAGLDSVLGATVSVFNAGVPGYSVRQMRQTIQELVPELRPQVIVFAVNGETYWRVSDPYVLLGTQLVRASAVPYVVEARRGLYYRRFTSWNWLGGLDLWLNQHFEFGAHVMTVAQLANGVLARASSTSTGSAGASLTAESPLEPQFAPVLAEIDSVWSLADSAGAALVVLLVNPQASDGSFPDAQYRYNQILRSHCMARGIDVLDPLPSLAGLADGKPIMRSADDYHWSGKAHEAVAAVLREHLVRSGLVDAAIDTAPPPSR